MESAGVQYLCTRSFCIRNRTSEHSERVRKYRTKRFPCGIVFIICILRHSSFWQPLYFKSFQNAKFAATHRKMTTKSKYQLISKNVC